MGIVLIDPLSTGILESVVNLPLTLVELDH